MGECFFWYRLTRVVQRKGHKTVVVLLSVTLLPKTNVIGLCQDYSKLKVGHFLSCNVCRLTTASPSL